MAHPQEKRYFQHNNIFNNEFRIFQPKSNDLGFLGNPPLRTKTMKAGISHFDFSEEISPIIRMKKVQLQKNQQKMPLKKQL